MLFLTLCISAVLPHHAFAASISSTNREAVFDQSAFGTLNFAVTDNATPIDVSETEITGTAWGEVIGWVQFGPLSNGGVDVSCSGTTGTLSGSAWGEQSGWLNFGPFSDAGATQVTINENGEFSGEAWSEHAGWLSFSCPGAGCVQTETQVCVEEEEEEVVSPRRTRTIPRIIVPRLAPGEQGTPAEGDDKPEGLACEPYLTEYIQFDTNNNPEQVQKLQQFLNEKQGETLSVTGTYDFLTFEAVKRYQGKYAAEILGPWGGIAPSGYVYKTTVRHINSFYCDQAPVCPFFSTYQDIGDVGDVGGEVRKIQQFLFDRKYYTGAISGVFDNATREGVKAFQQEFSDQILAPWGLSLPTGFWYKTTRKHANALMGCFEDAVLLEGTGTVLE